MHKVLYLSDIHIDMDGSLPDHFKNQLDLLYREGHFDTLLVVGDISNNYLTSVAYLERLNKDFPTRAVLGNHDLYNTKQDIIEVLDDFYKKEVCLTSNPIIHDNSIILGNIGWHDYTCYMGRGRYNEKSSNFDYFRMNWGDYTNKDLVDIIESEMDQLLSDATLKGLKNIIPVTHYAPHIFLVNNKQDPASNMFGNSYSHELYKKHDIKEAIYGHTHARETSSIHGIKYHSNSIGYPQEFMFYSEINGGRIDREDNVILNNLRTIKI